jgi:hypothetical protein
MLKEQQQGLLDRDKIAVRDLQFHTLTLERIQPHTIIMDNNKTS